MDRTAPFGPSRWTGLDRMIVAGLLVVSGLGTPGLGIETRETPSDAGALAALFTVAFLLPFVGLVASWKWPRPAAWSAVAGALLAVVVAAVDLAGLLPPAPPPPGMIGVYSAVVILGAVVAWRMWRLLRS